MTRERPQRQNCKVLQPFVRLFLVYMADHSRRSWVRRAEVARNRTMIMLLLYKSISWAAVVSCQNMLQVDCKDHSVSPHLNAFLFSGSDSFLRSFSLSFCFCIISLNMPPFNPPGRISSFFGSGSSTSPSSSLVCNCSNSSTISSRRSLASFWYRVILKIFVAVMSVIGVSSIRFLARILAVIAKRVSFGPSTSSRMADGA